MSTGNALFAKALESVGGRKEFERKSRQYSESVHFIDRDRSRLLESYDKKWIAVYNSKVVASDEKYLDIMKTIKQMKLPIEEMVIKFLSSRKVMTLF